MKEPANEQLRHPPGVIDQRQQRIDPANKVTRDPNEKTDPSVSPADKPAHDGDHPLSKNPG